MPKTSTTTLNDIGRRIRQEPAWYIFTHKIFVEKDAVSPAEVVDWCRSRYASGDEGHRYRVATYNHVDGNKYVDCFYLETCNDTDEVFIKMKWGYRKSPVKRDGRVKNKRLSKDDRAKLDAFRQKLIDDAV